MCGSLLRIQICNGRSSECWIIEWGLASSLCFRSSKRVNHWARTPKRKVLTIVRHINMWLQQWKKAEHNKHPLLLKASASTRQALRMKKTPFLQLAPTCFTMWCLVPLCPSRCRVLGSWWRISSSTCFVWATNWRKGMNSPGWCDHDQESRLPWYHAIWARSILCNVKTRQLCSHLVF